MARAWELGSVVEGEVAIARRGELSRLVCIPVRWQGRIGGDTDEGVALSVGRRPGQLERVYVEVFDRLARMISRGEFPFPVDETNVAETPRVGDGVLVLDASARVEFASPERDERPAPPRALLGNRRSATGRGRPRAGRGVPRLRDRAAGGGGGRPWRDAR